MFRQKTLGYMKEWHGQRVVSTSPTKRIQADMKGSLLVSAGTGLVVDRQGKALCSLDNQKMKGTFILVGNPVDICIFWLSADWSSRQMSRMEASSSV